MTTHTIDYTVGGGTPNYTVNLVGPVTDTNVHSVDGDYTFTGATAGSYVIVLEDSIGCSITSNTFNLIDSTTTSTTTTTTTLAPTTSTSTTSTSTTTTTTLPVIEVCPVFLSDTFLTLNSFNIYPSIIIDLGDGTVGNVVVPYVANDTPNRFTIRKFSDSSIVYSSDWFGHAEYSGPWGFGSPGTPYDNNSSGNFNFTKDVGERYYTLTVETVTGPIDSDSWSVNFPCAPTTTTTTTTTSTSTTTLAVTEVCPVFLTDSFLTLNTFYIYPSIVIDLGDGTSGNLVVPYVAGDTPNRFTVRKYSDSSIVYSSAWFGHAEYSGPWGFADPGAPYDNNSSGNFNFTKDVGERYYTLTVETVTGPIDSDSWSTNFPCPV